MDTKAENHRAVRLAPNRIRLQKHISELADTAGEETSFASTQAREAQFSLQSWESENSPMNTAASLLKNFRTSFMHETVGGKVQSSA